MKEANEMNRFIRKKLQAGYPAGELKNDLLAKGYSEEEIEKFFLDISVKGQDRGEKKATKKTGIHVVGLLGASLFITGLALMSTRIWLSNYSVHMIILGAIGIGVGYFIPAGKGPGRSSS